MSTNYKYINLINQLILPPQARAPYVARLPDSSAGGESSPAAGVSIVEYYQTGLRKVEVLHMFVK